MAGMAALQGAMAGLSVSAPGAASTSSFWGNRLATYSAPQPGRGGRANSSVFPARHGARW